MIDRPSSGGAERFASDARLDGLLLAQEEIAPVLALPILFTPVSAPILAKLVTWMQLSVPIGKTSDYLKPDIAKLLEQKRKDFCTEYSCSSVDVPLEKVVPGQGSALGATGNCTPEEHRSLQDRVENACGSASKCVGTDTAAILNMKIGRISQCIDARKAINNICYNGGDIGPQ